MMKTLIGAALALMVLCGHASAFTCDDVRRAIETLPDRTINGLKHTVPASQIKKACECIPHDPRCRGVLR